MRDIKFKAWDRKEKKMYKSVGFRDSDCGRVILPELPMMLVGDDKWKEQYIAGYSVYDIWNGKQQLRFELLEFTGLRDKNNKEIYEGDIIRHYYRDKYEIFLIEWFNNYAGFNLSGDWPNYEIIGNIYENPELLEKKETQNEAKECS